MPGINGFLNLLKPAGMTSSDAVVTVRRSLGRIKTGHAGTLDPEAAGVLPIMIGNAARLFDYLIDGKMPASSRMYTDIQIKLKTNIDA